MAAECKWRNHKEKKVDDGYLNGGLAIYINRWFDVGATCVFTLPRIRDCIGRRRGT